MSSVNEPHPQVVRKQIDVGDAELDVSIGDTTLTPVLCAAHPAGEFGESVVELLEAASGHGVVCINPRGIGHSSAPARGRDHTLDDMVDDFEVVRRHLALGPWVFWGMSGGGWLGEVYARRYPDALAGVILESACACFRLRLADPTCILSPLHASWHDPLASRGLIAAGSHDSVGDPKDTEWIDVEGVGPVFRRRQGPALLVSVPPPSAEMRSAMPLLWAVDQRTRLDGIRMPALVMCGTADPVVPLSHARLVYESIPNAEFAAIEGGGHVPVAQRHPAVAEAVRRFLRDRVVGAATS